MGVLHRYITSLGVLLALCFCKGSEVSIGSFSTIQHEVAGSVYAIGPNKLRIKNFNYDGNGPDAFFWAGIKGTSAGANPDSNGVIVLDENGSTGVLSAYTNADIVITLPDSHKVWDVKWLSVWCRKFTVDFGNLIFPGDLEGKTPKPLSIGKIAEFHHGVRSGDIVIKDTKTIEIPDFYYDGRGPDAFFIVGKGSPKGTDTKVPDENGSLDKLKKYSGKTVTLTLPGSLTVNDIDYLSAYCIAAVQNFGHVEIPANPFVPEYHRITMDGLENCEPMHSRLNVAWELDGSSLTLELAGTLDENEYMAFGMSGSEDRSAMIGAEVVVVHMSQQYGLQAADYKLTAYTQCASGQGACPLTSLGQENVVEIIGTMTRDGVTKVRVKRPIWRTDITNLYVVWAIGGYNKDLGLATKHSLKLTENKMVDFSRSGTDSCSDLQPLVKPQLTPWSRNYISGMDTNVFTVNIGPAGGSRGFSAITGTESWGIAWYVNGNLIPEITLRRGDNFTFIVQGGSDTSDPAHYHPFYITTSPRGGKDTIMKSGGSITETVFKLTDSSNKEIETGVGSYCEWKSATDVNPDDFDTFQGYAAKLNKECMGSDYGVYTWIPSSSTPDTVYYQCYTHRFLGWKINLVNEYSSAVSLTAVTTHVCLLLCLVIAYLYQ